MRSPLGRDGPGVELGDAAALDAHTANGNIVAAPDDVVAGDQRGVDACEDVAPLCPPPSDHRVGSLPLASPAHLDLEAESALSGEEDQRADVGADVEDQ